MGAIVSWTRWSGGEDRKREGRRIEEGGKEDRKREGRRIGEGGKEDRRGRGEGRREE